jgi:hypothetical protein
MQTCSTFIAAVLAIAAAAPAVAQDRRVTQENLGGRVQRRSRQRFGWTIGLPSL